MLAAHHIPSYGVSSEVSDLMPWLTFVKYGIDLSVNRTHHEWQDTTRSHQAHHTDEVIYQDLEDIEADCTEASPECLVKDFALISRMANIRQRFYNDSLSASYLTFLEV